MMVEGARLWQVDLQARLAIERIEKAIAESGRLLAEREEIAATAEVQRVDVSERRTIVFVTGTQLAADLFAKAVMADAYDSKANVRAAGLDELMAPPQA